MYKNMDLDCKHIKKIKEILFALKQNNFCIDLWGYGTKAETFMELMGTDLYLIDKVIDTDKEKQGKCLNSGLIILSPEQVEVSDLILLIQNIRGSVCFTLTDQGLKASEFKIISVEELVKEKVLLEDIISGKAFKHHLYYEEWIND